MARGWESKSVASQMEAAAAAKASRSTPPTLPDLDWQRQFRNLSLSRTRVLQDLEAAINPRYRQMLEAALAHLDNQLADLEKRKPQILKKLFATES